MPYLAIVHKEPNSDFGVSFPDFPGCITAGSTLDEARAMAKEALALHIEGMIEDGETIPKATPIPAIDIEAGFIAVLIVAAPVRKELEPA
jgi:predicted RNase H-like HicB family nuclease